MTEEKVLPHVSTMEKKEGKMMDVEKDENAKDLLLIGCGHAHVFLLKNFGMKPSNKIRVTLISEGIDTPYSGMIPGFVSGFYKREECYLDCLRLAEFSKARFIKGRVKKIDLENKKVMLENMDDIEYDVCSIDIGSSPMVREERKGKEV